MPLRAKAHGVRWRPLNSETPTGHVVRAVRGRSVVFELRGRVVRAWRPSALDALVLASRDGRPGSKRRIRGKRCAGTRHRSSPIRARDARFPQLRHPRVRGCVHLLLRRSDRRGPSVLAPFGSSENLRPPQPSERCRTRLATATYARLREGRPPPTHWQRSSLGQAQIGCAMNWHAFFGRRSVVVRPLYKNHPMSAPPQSKIPRASTVNVPLRHVRAIGDPRHAHSVQRKTEARHETHPSGATPNPTCGPCNHPSRMDTTKEREASAWSPQPNEVLQAKSAYSQPRGGGCHPLNWLSARTSPVCGPHLAKEAVRLW